MVVYKVDRAASSAPTAKAPVLIKMLAAIRGPAALCRPKFVEFRPNEFIKVVKNPDYWKPGVPHLDNLFSDAGVSAYNMVRYRDPPPWAPFSRGQPARKVL